MKHEKEHKFLFELIDSALNGTLWHYIPENMDWEYFLKLCCYQKIDNLIAYALDHTDKNTEIPGQISRALEHAREKGMAREATQYFSLEEIQKSFEEKGVQNIPLKGVQLKEYYPFPDMRFLTDLDILCRRSDANEIEQIMEELGYTLDHKGDHHDVYVRIPFMTVEIHWSCYTYNKKLDHILSEVWNRSQPWGQWKYSRKMGWEDYYVYMTGHMAKHLKYSGIGIRMLLDFYIFEQQLKKDCDWTYIKECLEKAELLKFAHTISDFTGTCLDQEGVLTAEYKILLEHILGSGAYGTTQNISGSQFLKDGGSRLSILKNRLRIIRSILFPSLSGMKQFYPWLNRWPVLLPAAWGVRLTKKFIFENRRSRSVFIKGIDTRYVKQMDKVHRAAGLY